MHSYELISGMSAAVLAVALLALYCNIRRDLMMFSAEFIYE